MCAAGGHCVWPRLDALLRVQRSCALLCRAETRVTLGTQQAAQTVRARASSSSHSSALASGLDKGTLYRFRIASARELQLEPLADSSASGPASR
eukprot:1557151-Rhodomonas_salina.1